MNRPLKLETLSTAARHPKAAASVTTKASRSAAVAARRLPVGAELVEGGVSFRVWAPRPRQVEVAIIAGGQGSQGRFPRRHALLREQNGYFSTLAEGIAAGSLYHFMLDGEERRPDPASRFQPEGPHGPSMVVDPFAYRWRAQDWKGLGRNGHLIYEMHVGTFTRRGTWGAAIRQLKHLAEVGVSVIELMPVADFAGTRGWGYDGVDLFAPTRLYGPPDDMRAFVDEAHLLGMGVILDVVYNHLGPDGNFLRSFAPDYFSKTHRTDWGEAINFDGPNSRPVREFFLANARYWIEEFRIDGLRVDATQDIHDRSQPHILAELVNSVRTAAAGRGTLMVAENEPQRTILARPPSEGGYGFDMLWNDDLHHSAMVCLTGRREAYYSDHKGAPQEFISAAKYGYLFQGQVYSWQKQRRGTPTRGLKPSAFVNFVQNHDQLANSGRGQRCHEVAGPGRNRAMTALLLLMPGTPMLFQGQEFAASSPFFYFADHREEIAEQVWKGRAAFLAQFPSLATPEMQFLLPDPREPATFRASKLNASERQRNAEVLRLHRDLIALRRNDPVLRADERGRVDGAVLGPEAFLLRFLAEDGLDRLLIVNFGGDFALEPAPEPLIAPPSGRRWALRWSSEDPIYGGTGTPALETERGWQLPGRAAFLLFPADPEE